MCEVKGCKSKDIELMFYHHEVCSRCFSRHCDGKIDLKQLFFKPKKVKLMPSQDQIRRHGLMAYIQPKEVQHAAIN